MYVTSMHRTALALAALVAAPLAADDSALIFDFSLPSAFVADHEAPGGPVPEGVLWATRLSDGLFGLPGCSCPGTDTYIGVERLMGLEGEMFYDVPRADLGSGDLEPVHALQLSSDAYGVYRQQHCGTFRKWCPILVDFLEDLEPTGLELHFVFMDMEGAYDRENTVSVVRLLADRFGDDAPPAGNYAYHPGYSESHGGYLPDWGRSLPEHSFAYVNRAHVYRHEPGLDIAQPECYFRVENASHATGNWANVRMGGVTFDYQAPNVQAGIFWASLERMSLARRTLPQGDLLIPYVSPFTGKICRVCGDEEPEGNCCDVPYTAGVDPCPVPAIDGCGDGPPGPWPVYHEGAIGHPWRPSEADNRALIQHLRMRGADGYYMFHDAPAIDNDCDGMVGGSTCPNASLDERADDANLYRAWTVDAWNDLDPYFTNFRCSLNFRTSKRTGVQWSGIVYERNPGRFHARVLVSNLSGDDVDLDDLDTGDPIWKWFNWPDEFPDVNQVVPAGMHVSFDLRLAGWDASDCGAFEASPKDTFLPGLPGEFALQGDDHPGIDPGAYGRCDLPDRTCIETTSSGCAGEWTGIKRAVEEGTAYTCRDLDVGACCFGGNACQEMTPQECWAADGNFMGQGTCLDGMCLGACCLGTTCLEQTADDCATMGGTFAGAGVECAENAACPIGACCYGDSCQPRLPADCQAEGGVFMGADTTCDDCRGACCLAGGLSCADDFAIPCLAAGGSFAGVGTSCADTAVCAGACCLSDGTCVDLIEADCDKAAGSSFRGATSACDDPTLGCEGACCLLDVLCVDLSMDDCLSMQGLFAGVGVLCGEDALVCVPYPCCLPDGSCEEVSILACLEAGGLPDLSADDCATAQCSASGG